MGTYVGKWDCPRCGTKRIPGWKDGRTVETCPACGGPTTGKWYLDNRDMVIGNAEEVRKAQVKRAWTCGHCKHVNDADDDTCDACGNPRDASTDDTQFISREYKPGDVPLSDEDTEDPNTEAQTDRPADTQEGFSRSARARYETEKERYRLQRRRRNRIILVVLGSIAALIFSLLWSREVQVVVTGFSWERKVDIEVYGPHSESCWDSPPSGAYGISSAVEIHHYNTIVVGRDCHTETSSVVCGTTDNGNGTFTDRYCDESYEVCEDRTVEEAVYATRYYYTIDRWGFDHTEEAKAPDHTPIWPSYALTISNPGKYREGKRSETYTVHVQQAGHEIDDSEMKLPDWAALKPGQQLRGSRNVIFGYWMGLKD